MSGWKHKEDERAYQRKRNYKREYAQRVANHGSAYDAELRHERHVRRMKAIHGENYKPRKKYFQSKNVPLTELIADAHYAYGTVPTPNEIVLGDPPRGRSALERRS